MGYDIEPGTTTVYKQKFYDLILDKNLNMIFEHDNEIIGGSLRVNERNQFELSHEIKSEQKSFQLLS